jgi:hypothetical protein
MYNVWCNQMTQIAWESGNLTISDPEATEAECWATISIYPTYHKIIGNLTESVLSMIKQYVRIHLLKNSTNSWKVGKHKLTCSQGILDQRASIAKLLHYWIPIFGSLCCQGQEPSPLCLRCSLAVKDYLHIRICPAINAQQAPQ